jgi:hypothetical protein
VSFDTGKPEHLQPGLSSKPKNKNLSREAKALLSLERMKEISFTEGGGSGKKGGAAAGGSGSGGGAAGQPLSAAEKKAGLLGVSKSFSETSWVEGGGGKGAGADYGESNNKGKSKGKAAAADASSSSTSSSSSLSTVRVETFPKNRVGLHVVELHLPTSTSTSSSSEHLELVAVRRFDLYNSATAAGEFVQWVESLPPGRIVVIAIR